MHALDDAGAAAVLARLRYLMKHGFPRHFETSRGARTTMGFEDALKMATAFELLSLGMATSFVVNTVNAKWDELGPFLAAAFRRSQDGAGGDAIVLSIKGEGLNGTEGDASATLRFRTAGRETNARRLVANLDLSAFVDALAEAIHEELVATPAAYRNDVADFCARHEPAGSDQTRQDASQPT